MKKMNMTLVAGSIRSNAVSTQVLTYMRRLLEAKQVSVTFIDLARLPLPLFSADQSKTHPYVRQFLDAIELAEGVILATPEYHGSLSGALKNALDHVNAGQIAGKAVLSVSSAGGPVGISSLTHLQTIVRNLHGVNCTQWVSVGNGSNAFDADGVPMDEDLRARIDGAVDHLVELASRLPAKPAHAQ